jgi:antitoxin (DNA-binding transcriptional repressor) of toxin-antitoxin stability system
VTELPISLLGDDVGERVGQGERFILTDEGQPIAEVRPLPRRSVPTAEIVEAMRALPPMDTDRFMADLDAFYATYLW